MHIISQNMVINYNCCPVIKKIVNRRRTENMLSMTNTSLDIMAMGPTPTEKFTTTGKECS